MSNKIVINTGFKTYDLVNEKGKLLGQISFNPSDVNITQRYKKVVEDLEKIDVEINKGDETEDLIESIRKVDEIIYEKIDYLTNANIAETLFSIVGPFSPMPTGQYFVEYIMEVIGNIITQETGERVKKMSKRIQKHTKKYHG